MEEWQVCRDELIVRMRHDELMSLGEIAGFLRVSKQRIDQILVDLNHNGRIRRHFINEPRSRYFPKYLSLKPIIDNSELNNDGCLIWNGYHHPTMGGMIFAHGKRYAAHRVVFELYNKQKLTPGQYVFHKCNNKYCVNPNHLYIKE